MSYSGRLGIAALCCFATMGALPVQAQQSGLAIPPRTFVMRFSGNTTVEGAVTPEALRQPMTLTLRRVTVETALRTISERTRLGLSYDRRLVSLRDIVTVDVRDGTVADALRQTLRGQPLELLVSSTGEMALVSANPSRSDERTSEISGSVIDGATKRPLAGVTVAVDNERQGVRTDASGVFRISGISRGAHRLSLRLLGYTRQVRQITVEENGVAGLVITLEPSVNALDQVVVTGTVVATELKAVPNAITVITAKQIEERGVTRIDQLFRGDVPGLYAMNRGSESLLDGVMMYSRGASSIGSNSARGSRDNTNPIKTYVDGIELSDPQYLSQIDPRSIERIEILTGPQASTIYGSNALNGVMQIFTKRGKSSAPQMTLELMNGWVQSNFSNALTPYHDYTAQVSGVDGHVSYNGGGNWNYMGPWTPSKQTTRMGAFGSVRFVMPTAAGTVTSDFSYRHSLTQNRKFGRDDQIIGHYKATGWYSGSANDWAGDHVFSKLKGQTAGMTLGYTPWSWWSHELTVGQDDSGQEIRQLGSLRSPRDTVGSFSQPTAQRRSLRYATTVQIPMRELARVTVTAGGDSWQDRYDRIYGSRTAALSANRITSHNAGGFLQAQLGVRDHFFLTYGLRAEWNPVFGKEAMPAYSPRYGATYTTELGPVTAKVRGSYGRSTRPPSLDQKRASRSSDIEQIGLFGPFDEQIANPELGPEHQQGGEGGVELYFGGRASLVVTRYNQTVEGLVTRIFGADSVKSLKPNPAFYGGSWSCAAAVQAGYRFLCSSQDADGFGYRWIYQNINAASIRNQGWELQGSTMFGPLTVRGTYSWTKSRVIGVTDRYREKMQVDRFAPLYKPGATFAWLPEHTGAMGLTYAHARTSANLNMTWTGALRSDISEFKNKYLEGGLRLREDKLINTGQGHDAYVDVNPGYAQMDFMVTHRIVPRAEALLQIQNLTDRYTNDYRAFFATMGRQTKVGLRLR